MTLTELGVLWAERDERYRSRRFALSPEEIAAVRAWRLGEVNALPPHERGVRFREAVGWEPPWPNR